MGAQASRVPVPRGSLQTLPPSQESFGRAAQYRKQAYTRKIFPTGPAISTGPYNGRKGAGNMSGKRQPTALVAANGRKHLSRPETDERLDQEVHVPPPEQALPPKWLPKRLHKKFHEVGEILLAAGLYAELDRDVLAQYFIARDRWLKADKKAAAAIQADDEKLAREWTGVQGTYFRQARQCAESMGLSVTSRCRIVVPAAVVNAAGAPADEDDEFTRRLRARQDAAMEKAGN